MLSITLLDQLHTIVLYADTMAVLSSFYLYTQMYTIRITPITSLIPVISTLCGIAFFYWIPPLSIASIFFILLLTLFFLPRTYVPFALHAIICAGLSTGMLFIDTQRLTQKKAIISKEAHTLYGLVIDMNAWQSAKNGTVATIALMRIDGQETTGMCKLFTYSPQKLIIGSFYTFFNITLSDQHNKPELASYGHREHMLGVQFSPFVRAKKNNSSTIYSAWIAYWAKWRNSLYKTLQGKLSQKSFSYMSALFFGNKNIPDFLEIRTDFTRWGLTHYLARSGLHISLLVSLWISILRILPVGISIKAILLFFVLGIYDKLSWANISFNRALWLWFFYLGSWLTSRVATPVFGLAQLTLAILLINPWYASCLDFQLSFFLTSILMLYSYYRAQQKIKMII